MAFVHIHLICLPSFLGLVSKTTFRLLDDVLFVIVKQYALLVIISVKTLRTPNLRRCWV